MVSITRLSGGVTPADGGDPRTFPAIWNDTSDDIEAGEYSKVPTGGSAGDVLVKQSATDYDGAWEKRSVPWVAISGRFYGGVGNSFSLTTLNELVYSAVYFSQPTVVDGLRIDVTTAGASGAAMRLGLYAPGHDGAPSALIVDAGTVETDSTGTKVITISETVTGLVWVAAVSQVNTSTVRVSSGSSTLYEGGDVGGAGGQNRSVALQTGVSGALPSTAAPNGQTANAIRVLARVG
jgi:hypothetical protein